MNRKEEDLMNGKGRKKTVKWRKKLSQRNEIRPLLHLSTQRSHTSQRAISLCFGSPTCCINLRALQAVQRGPLVWREHTVRLDLHTNMNIMGWAFVGPSRTALFLLVSNRPAKKKKKERKKNEWKFWIKKKKEKRKWGGVKTSTGKNKQQRIAVFIKLSL